VREAVRSGDPALLVDRAPAVANAPSVTGVYDALGLNGTAVPLTGSALDTIGLAYPLAAHAEPARGGRVGHDKHLPSEWVVAERGTGRGAAARRLDPARVAAARRGAALRARWRSCGRPRARR